MTGPVTEGYSVYSGRGNVAAAENDYVWVPNNRNAFNKYGVVLCHGRGVPDEFMTSAQARILAASLATAGFPCVAAEMGGNIWANDTAMARINSAFTFLKSKVSYVHASKLHLIGISMGGATAIRYAEENPANVVSIHGLLPVSSIINIYVNNVSGLQAEIADAWGVVAPAALPVGADLLSNASQLGDIPLRMYYADGDLVVDSADMVALASSSNNADVIGPLGASGHSNASIGIISQYGQGNWSDVISRLEQFGAL